MIKLTEDAAKQILIQAKQSGAIDEPLRIAVRQGNSGDFQYLMGFDEVKEGDNQFEARGVKLVIAENDVPLVSNMEVDRGFFNALRATKDIWRISPLFPFIKKSLSPTLQTIQKPPRIIMVFSETLHIIINTFHIFRSKLKDNFLVGFQVKDSGVFALCQEGIFCQQF